MFMWTQLVKIIITIYIQIVSYKTDSLVNLKHFPSFYFHNRMYLWQNPDIIDKNEGGTCFYP